MPTFIPFWEYFPATYKIICRRSHGRVQVWTGSERTMERTGRPRRMQVLKNDSNEVPMQRAWCNDECNKQINTRRSRKTWKASGASVSRRYNSPPLTEDLVPRSRTAPERSGRGRGKTKLLLWQTSETTNLERLNKLKERIQRRWTRLQTIR